MAAKSLSVDDVFSMLGAAPSSGTASATTQPAAPGGSVRQDLTAAMDQQERKSGALSIDDVFSMLPDAPAPRQGAPSPRQGAPAETAGSKLPDEQINIPGIGILNRNGDDLTPATTSAEAAAEGGGAANFGAGVSEALGGLVGLPMSAYGYVQRKMADGGIGPFALPDAVKSFGESLPQVNEGDKGTATWFNKQMGDIGYDPATVVPQDFGDRLARGAGRGVVGGAPFGLAGTVVGGISGLTGAAAAEVAPEGGIHYKDFRGDDSEINYKALADFGGQLVGGGLAAAASGPVQAATRATLRAAEAPLNTIAAPVKALTKATGITEGGRERAVVGELRRHATDPEALVGKIDAGATELIPGSAPTLYQATGDTGLGVLERGVNARNPSAFLDQRAAQNTARTNAVEGLAPADAQPGLVAQKIETQLRGISDDFDNRIAAAIAERDQAVSGMGGTGERSAYGEQFRATLEEAKKAEKAKVQALYSRIDPDNSLALDIGGVKQAANEIRSSLPKAAQMAPDEARLHAVLDSLPEVEKFSELTALRGELLGAIRQERFSNGETPALRRMQQLRSSIDNTIGAAAEAPAARLNAADVGRNTSPLADGGLTPNFGPEDAARYRMAATANREMAERFKSGPVGKVLNAGPDGAAFKVADSEVAGKLFNSGSRSKEDVEAFAAAIGDRKVAARQLYEYAASDLRSKAMNDTGSLDLTKWRNWMNKHHESLRTLDRLSGSMELRGRFMKASEAQKAVDELGAGKAQTVKEFEDSAARHFLNREDPVTAVGKALDEPNPVRAMRELRAMVGNDQEALNGLRRGVIEHMKRRFVSNAEAGDTGLGAWKADQFQTYVKAHRDALGAVFTPEQVKVFTAMVEDLQRANRSIVGAKIPGGSNTAQDLIAAGRTANRVISVLENMAPFAALGGGFSVGGIAGAVAAGLLSKPLAGFLRRLGPGKLDALLEEAVLDPSIARALLKKYPANKVPEELVSWLGNRMERVGLVAKVTAANAVLQGAEGLKQSQ